MPIQSTTYNTQLTSEALEKKFRDTFVSQGGAELISDLYASGTIVPVVDFTAAAQGSELPTFLQTAWGYSSNRIITEGATNTLLNTPGFYKVWVSLNYHGSASPNDGFVYLTDGLSQRPVWEVQNLNTGGAFDSEFVVSDNFYVFLRSGDQLAAASTVTGLTIVTITQPVADLYGSLINPLGYTSS